LTSDANHIVHVKVTAPLVPPQVQMG
jgi:hypothetical protein